MLCSMLFQSVSKVGHFKDLKIFYFHNRLGKLVYREPTLALSSAVETEWILKNLSSDYRVIFIGDAEMSVNDLLGKNGPGGLKSGMDWAAGIQEPLFPQHLAPPPGPPQRAQLLDPIL